MELEPIHDLTYKKIKALFIFIIILNPSNLAENVKRAPYSWKSMELSKQSTYD